MILDFAIKDFYRKREQTFPYMYVIMIVVSLGIFLMNFLTSIGYNILVQENFNQTGSSNPYFFSNSIGLHFTNYFIYLIGLVLVLVFIIIISITTTLLSFKQKDIAVFKSLGILPNIIYNFYLAEAFLLFFLGFILGLLTSSIAYGIFISILIVLNFKLTFQFNLVFIFILFGVCLFGIYFVSGSKLRKMGLQKVSENLSGEITFETSTRTLIKVPDWIYKLGPNLKIALTNIKRKKQDFFRILFVFGFVCLVLFTIGIGTINIGEHSQRWINQAQGDNIYAIGHEDVLTQYSKMYEMFSDPSLMVSPQEINFTQSDYLINEYEVQNLKDQIGLKIDQRLITFEPVKEVPGYSFSEKQNINDSGIVSIGKNREGIFPVIGIRRESMCQNFSFESGDFFNNSNLEKSIVIGDGLSQNLFEKPLEQKLIMKEIERTFEISGVLRDTFYSGFVSYIDLNIFQEELNMSNFVNMLLINLQEEAQDNTISIIEEFIENTLGSDFIIISLNPIFIKNLDFVSSLLIFPISIGIIILFVTVFSLINYQKAGLLANAKDFIIMKAVGAQNNLIKRILNIEGIFIIFPAILYGFILGLFLNVFIIFQDIPLASPTLPLILIPILFTILTTINYNSVNMIMKKVRALNIKDLK
jgi:ABC-type antimicrobial peptide transport system permease subunit